MLPCPLGGSTESECQLSSSIFPRSWCVPDRVWDFFGGSIRKRARDLRRQTGRSAEGTSEGQLEVSLALHNRSLPYKERLSFRLPDPSSPHPRTASCFWKGQCELHYACSCTTANASTSSCHEESPAPPALFTEMVIGRPHLETWFL